MPLVESLLRGSQGLGMLHGPRIQGRERFIERSAERGHHIFDARRCGVDEPALPDAVSLQPAQGLCESLLRNAIDPSAHFVEAQCASGSADSAQDENAPPVSDLVEEQPVEFAAVVIRLPATTVFQGADVS